MSEENVQVVSGVHDAFGRGDVEAVLAQMDQGIERNEAENFPYADGNPHVGPQAILEGVFVRLMADWEGFAGTPEELLDAGDRVVGLGTYTGTHNATGRGVRTQFAHVWGLSEGWAVSFQQYTDTKQLADAVA